MEANILPGGSCASKDKCFLLLPFLLPKAVLWSLHSGWESTEPVSVRLAGVTLPEGRGQPHGLGAGGRGARRWPHTPGIVHRGWKSALLMLDHAANQPDKPDSRRPLSNMGMLLYMRTFFPACFYHLSSDCTNKNWVLMDIFAKSIGRRERIIGVLPLKQNYITQYVMMLPINKQCVAVERIVWREGLGINTPFWSLHSASIATVHFHGDLG